MNPRALVVDDDPAIQAVIGDIVRSLGHEFDVADTVEAAKQRRLDEYTYFVIDLEAAKKPLRENAQPWHGICARP